MVASDYSEIEVVPTMKHTKRNRRTSALSGILLALALFTTTGLPAQTNEQSLAVTSPDTGRTSIYARHGQNTFVIDSGTGRPRTMPT